MKLLGTYVILAIISINTSFASMGSIPSRSTVGEASSSICKDNKNAEKRVLTKEDLVRVASLDADIAEPVSGKKEATSIIK